MEAVLLFFGDIRELLPGFAPSRILELFINMDVSISDRPVKSIFMKFGTEELYENLSTL
jgi:hypothetical protein